jgi:hypothetical protein
MLLFESIVTDIELSVPWKSPLHSLNKYPVDGAASILTTVPSSKVPLEGETLPPSEGETLMVRE